MATDLAEDLILLKKDSESLGMVMPVSIADPQKIREAYKTSLLWIRSILVYAKTEPPRKMRLALQEAVDYIDESLGGANGH